MTPTKQQFKSQYACYSSPNESSDDEETLFDDNQALLDVEVRCCSNFFLSFKLRIII
jgi:hypothetical protein